jgi:hypothetical protein
MTNTDWSRVLKEAVEAGDQAYRAKWTEEGLEDKGWCGSAHVEVSSEHPLAKAAIFAGVGDLEGFRKGFTHIRLTPPSDLPFVQSANINEARAHAVRDYLVAAGVKCVRVEYFSD